MTLYRIEIEQNPWHEHLRSIADAWIKSGRLVEVEKCVHGKYDGHWPSGKCNCTTNEDTGGRGHWHRPWVASFKRDWIPCPHEPWCPGAGLEAPE